MIKSLYFKTFKCNNYRIGLQKCLNMLLTIVDWKVKKNKWLNENEWKKNNQKK